MSLNTYVARLVHVSFKSYVISSADADLHCN